MTWTRVKRWLAEHPGLSLAPLIPLGVVVLAVGLFVCYFSAFHAHPSAPQVMLSPEVVELAFLAVAYLAALGAWAYWIGCLRARAGLPVRPAVLVSLYGWLAAVILGSLVAPVYGTLAAAVMASVLLTVTLLGLVLARRVARRKIVSGQWETTIPAPSPNSPQPPGGTTMTWERTQRWLARHPVVPLAPLVAAGTLALVSLLATCDETVLPPGTSKWQHAALAGLGLLVAVMTLGGVGLGAFWIGLLRWRAGLEIGRTDGAAAIGCPLAAIIVGILIVLLVDPNDPWLQEVTYYAMGFTFCIGWVSLLIAIVGLRLAAPYARRKVARGQWDARR